MATPSSDPESWFDGGADLPEAVGVVPTTGRGSLPFLLLNGEPLVQVCSWALEDAGAELADFDTPWSEVRSWARPVVLHDPLCPLTPPEFLREAIRAATEADGPVVVVGTRPVTDTVKHVEDGVVGDTEDRDELMVVASPVVLSPAAVEALEEWPDLDDLAALVGTLRERYEVRFLDAPEEARRIGDESDLALLEASAPRA